MLHVSEDALRIFNIVLCVATLVSMGINWRLLKAQAGGVNLFRVGSGFTVVGILIGTIEAFNAPYTAPGVRVQLFTVALIFLLSSIWIERITKSRVKRFRLNRKPAEPR